MEIEFRAPPPFRDPGNSTVGASSAHISTETNPGGDNARSCSDIWECH